MAEEYVEVCGISGCAWRGTPFGPRDPDIELSPDLSEDFQHLLDVHYIPGQPNEAQPWHGMFKTYERVTPNG